MQVEPGKRTVASFKHIIEFSPVSSDGYYTIDAMDMVPTWEASLYNTLLQDARHPLLRIEAPTLERMGLKQLTDGRK